MTNLCNTTLQLIALDNNLNAKIWDQQSSNSILLAASRSISSCVNIPWYCSSYCWDHNFYDCSSYCWDHGFYDFL